MKSEDQKSVGGDKKEDGELRWYTIHDRLRFSAQLSCKEEFFLPTGQKQTKGEDIEAKFDEGFFATADPKVQALIEAHPYFNSDIPVKCIRRCTDEEVAMINSFHEKGFPRKTWHKRITVMKELQSEAFLEV